jgi:hypothetical protein
VAGTRFQGRDRAEPDLSPACDANCMLSGPARRAASMYYLDKQALNGIQTQWNIILHCIVAIKSRACDLLTLA